MYASSSLLIRQTQGVSTFEVPTRKIESVNLILGFSSLLSTNTQIESHSPAHTTTNQNKIYTPLMKSIKMVILILLSTILFICSTSDAIKLPLLINCGLPKSSTVTSFDSQVWQSDVDPTFAPPNINTISNSVMSNPTSQPPFESARLFRSPVTYTFSLVPGPIFIRLYFSTSISYQNIPSYQFSTSLVANDFTLLNNFNPYLNPQKTTLTYEFQVIIPDGENNLKLTFSPGEKININNSNTSTTSSSPYGYVNGIEIRSIPDELYINNETNHYIYVNQEEIGYQMTKTSSAFQTVCRLVCGTSVDPKDDSPEGRMMRAWETDDSYVFGDFHGSVVGRNRSVDQTLTINYTKIPTYVAPRRVYASTRLMGEGVKFDLARNLTWKFVVDPGFDYMLRLHLCENDISITGDSQRLMEVYIGGMVAQPDLDVYRESGGFGVPMYKDFVITMPGSSVSGVSNGSTVDLFLALRPQDARAVDVILSGVEVLKLSSNRNLAVPNPPFNAPVVQNQTTNVNDSTNKAHIIIIIVSIIGGLLLVTCILLALFRNRVPYKRHFISGKSSSKGQWLPTVLESQSSSANTKTNSSRASLPSDLCCRFSLPEIRVATSDFNENSVIGTGGFGKVYKGCIDNGTTSVAIKRLNPSSKQGEHEFLTEIEMLSRLRHVHLVSLIGYCEDNGEMILVYEYMPRGTLREHLNYKGMKGDKENDEVLPWKQRLIICLGSARGLDYLHAGTKQLIIHRDVKSTNILLDDKWTAKVSDFGLSKVGPANDTGVGYVSTAVKGSFGYLDPEYYRRQQLTEKSDVYSFGVVLFEVLCARQVVNPNLPKEQVNLANWARSCYKKGILHTIVDPNLTGQIAPECLRKFGEIADMCVRNHRDERPSMRDVVWSLEFALKLQETAEKNTSNGSPMVEVTSRDGGGNIGGDGDGSTDNDVFANSLGQSSGNAIDTQRFESNSGSTMTTATNSTDCHMDMKSGSVFSEILDPRAR